MKHYPVLSFCLILFFLFSSCGTSKEEQEAEAKRKEDSLAAAESAMKAAEEAARVRALADSASFVAVSDSLNEVAQ